MNAMRSVAGALWVAILGVIAMYVFFALTGALDPGEVAGLTVAVGVLAVIAAIHFVRVRHALSEHGDNELARTVHAMRERRGF